MKTKNISITLMLFLAIFYFIFYIWPNYSNYSAATHVSDWPIAVNACGLSPKDNDIPLACQKFLDSALGKSPKIALLHINSKSITLVGTKYKQTVVFWRELTQRDGYIWKCKGYPDADIPVKCRGSL
jgi:hypothetical protein